MRLIFLLLNAEKVKKYVVRRGRIRYNGLNSRIGHTGAESPDTK